MRSARATWLQYRVALRAMVILTVALGLVYPLAVTAVAQVAMPGQADGSAATDADGTVVGSTLIGQSFADADGNPLPQWFQPRPSAAGDGYDAGASSGSNLGPQNPDLVAAIAERRAAVAAFEDVAPEEVPVDALTASASGLDPDISPEYALLQVRRVAKANGLPEDQVRALVDARTDGRDLGYLGEPTVNVLELNLTLQELAGTGQ